MGRRRTRLEEKIQWRLSRLEDYYAAIIPSENVGIEVACEVYEQERQARTSGKQTRFENVMSSIPISLEPVLILELGGMLSMCSTHPFRR